jgi:O-acetyl-ADP-ribose deacetylase (regulator of RNase III)
MKLRDRLEAIEADITTLPVDAIVNAANAALLPGGGVDGAIRRRAGSEMDDDLAQIGSCAPGTAVITSGYDLPAKWVIHTVAPIWSAAQKTGEQEEVFARCYDSVLLLADQNEIGTLAFPAIGTGAYRWPATMAAQIAFQRIVSHLRACDAHTLITFCCFTRADRERYADMIAGLRD